MPSLQASPALGVLARDFAASPHLALQARRVRSTAPRTANFCPAPLSMPVATEGYLIFEKGLFPFLKLLGPNR